MTRAEIVGQNIRRLRKARGMTQVEFADAIERSQSVVAQYETGQRMPSTQIIVHISNVFGVTFDAIYNSDEERSKIDNEEWYNEYFGFGSETPAMQSLELSPQEVYLVQCFRDAEHSAQTYALQILENNPTTKKADLA